MKATAALLAFVLVGNLGCAAQSPPRANRAIGVGINEVTALIGDLRLNWSLTSSERVSIGRCSTGKIAHALRYDNYTLLLAPIPVDYTAPYEPDCDWNVCLVDQDTVVSWLSTTLGTPLVSLSRNGTSARVESVGHRVRMLKVLDSRGNLIFSDVWLCSGRRQTEWGVNMKDPGLLALSPTCQWVVVSDMTTYGDRVEGRGLVRVYDCSNGDEWEIVLGDFDVSGIRFLDDRTVHFDGTLPSGEPTWIKYATERRTLDLVTRKVR